MVFSVLHMTTTGGRTHELRREDCNPGDISALSSHIDRALTHRVDPIPTLAGHAALMDAEGPDLLVTVILDRQDGPVPLVTFGVATRASPNAERLWQMVGGTGDPPPVPWCAAKEAPYAPGQHVTLPEVEAYRRCLAWAWIDRVRGAS